MAAQMLLSPEAETAEEMILFKGASNGRNLRQLWADVGLQTGRVDQPASTE